MNMISGPRIPHEGNLEHTESDAAALELSMQEGEPRDARLAAYLAEVLDGLYRNIRFTKNGDSFVALAKDEVRLSNKLEEIIRFHFQEFLVQDEMSEAELQEVIARVVIEVPTMLESMKDEVRERFQKYFERFWYDQRPTLPGQRPRLVLTEPSGARVRAENRDQLIAEWMFHAQAQGPDHPNVYRFSEENLEFIRPIVEALVDQLLSDYKQQLAEGSEFK